jgi:hypothetical protein
VARLRRELWWRVCLQLRREAEELGAAREDARLRADAAAAALRAMEEAAAEAARVAAQRAAEVAARVEALEAGAEDRVREV